MGDRFEEKRADNRSRGSAKLPLQVSSLDYRSASPENAALVNAMDDR